MALQNADIEQDLFYVLGLDTGQGSETFIRRRAVVEENTGRAEESFPVCRISEHAPEGSAEQIARALNRLPKAEALLVKIAAAIREADGGHNQLASELLALPGEIEEFVCG